MATIIEVTNKKFQIPKTPYIIQTDVAAEEFEFQVTETDVDLSSLSFYLKYRNSQNRSEMVALTKLGTTSGGAIRLQWKPDVNFTSIKGCTDIQLMARDSATPTVVWNTSHTTVFLYEDVLLNSGGSVNTATPALFVQYLNSMEQLKTDSEAYAIGTRNGVAVGSADPAYHNNAKYYYELINDLVESNF